MEVSFFSPSLSLHFSFIFFFFFFSYHTYGVFVVYQRCGSFKILHAFGETTAFWNWGWISVNFKGVFGRGGGVSQALEGESISSARYLHFLKWCWRPKGEGLKGERLFWGLGWRGSVVLRSLQQLFKLTLFELSIVSDFVKCVRLHNLPVLKDCVQQVLEMNRKTRQREVRIKRKEDR